MDLIHKFKKQFKEAHEEINKQDEAKEAEKRGVLRAGSSGANVDGDIYSTHCGRLAQARFLGYQSPPTQEMRLMFNGGFTLEDYIEKRLITSGINFKKEQTVEGDIFPGIRISGRPDFEIILDGEEIGIEVKSLASPFSVIKHKKNRFPYMKHMIQAATYMTLTKRDRWMIVIGHSFHVNDRGIKAPPELVWYELKYINDLFVVTNDRNENATLPFTKKHIVAYYQQMQEGITTKKLMGRPKEAELNIDTYSRCKYCPMQSACNEYDAGLIDFESWLSRVTVSKEKEQGE